MGYFHPGVIATIEQALRRSRLFVYLLGKGNIGMRVVRHTSACGIFVRISHCVSTAESRIHQEDRQYLPVGAFDTYRGAARNTLCRGYSFTRSI